MSTVPNEGQGVVLRLRSSAKPSPYDLRQANTTASNSLDNLSGRVSSGTGLEARGSCHVLLRIERTRTPKKAASLVGPVREL
jgi:hypothetical protein